MLRQGAILRRHAQVAAAATLRPPFLVSATRPRSGPHPHAGRNRAHASASTAQHAVPWLQSLSCSPNLSGPPRTWADGKLDCLPPTDADAIVILAGGQTSGGSGLPEWVERRLDTCLGLQKLQTKACPIVCLGGGTPHKPPVVNPKGYVLHESTACADYLIARGLSPTLLLKEVSSYDTVGNAFFSLAIHALPAGWRKVLVVTSHFHMPRTRALFEDMYGLAARDLLGDPNRFVLYFASSSDDGLFTDAVLEARCEKEALSLQQWRRDVAIMPDFAALHSWLHQTHQCYAVARQHEFDKPTIVDPRLLASY